eukprot:Pgem_evm1s17557
MLDLNNNKQCPTGMARTTQNPLKPMPDNHSANLKTANRNTKIIGSDGKNINLYRNLPSNNGPGIQRRPGRRRAATISLSSH